MKNNRRKSRWITVTDLLLSILIFACLIWVFSLEGCAVNKDFMDNETHFASANHAYFSLFDSNNPAKYADQSEDEGWWGEEVKVGGTTGGL